MKKLPLKKSIIFLCLMLTHLIYSMDHKELQKKEVAQALGNLDFEKIEKLCKEGAINFEEAYVIHYTKGQIASFWKPLDFALFINNLELGKLLNRYGAQPDRYFYSELCRFACYRFLPLFYKYHPEGFSSCGENLLHLAVDTAKEKNCHELIASILLFFPQYREEKSFFSLEYAKSGWSKFPNSAKKAVEILENEKLLYDTMNKVSTEFFEDEIKNVKKYPFVKGREVGMNLHGIKEHQRFLKRRQQLLMNAKKEE